MEPEDSDNVFVQQNFYSICKFPGTIRTKNLGPCIGVCIASKDYAGIIHTADIDLDADNTFPAFVHAMKKYIPEDMMSTIRPVICGADVYDYSGTLKTTRDFEEHEAIVRKWRDRTIQLLNSAGFYQLEIRWNELGETTSLFADLEEGSIYIENGYNEIVQKWNIEQSES